MVMEKEMQEQETLNMDAKVAAQNKINAVIAGELLHPVCALMREDHGLVAVEIVDDLVIGRLVQRLDGGNVIVPVAADKDDDIGRDGADLGDAGGNDAVPGFGIGGVSHLVEQFEGNMLRIVTEAGGHLFPDRVEAILIRFVFKETGFGFVLVKTETRGLMQVQDDIEAIFAGPGNGTGQMGVAFFQHSGTVFALDDIEIKGKTDMVKSMRKLYERLAPLVFSTDGTKVYVNYNEQPATVDGVAIPALDWILR